MDLLYQLTETTECDFKRDLEVRKPKSWLKSVSAFANGIGGKLIFGIDDAHNIVGLNNSQEAAEAISRIIKAKITPIPQFVLSEDKLQEKAILILTVDAGRATPYYYKSDGVMEAYIRLGSESVIAPDYVLNELILKGKNQSFDALVTDARKEDYSFTLFEATYYERTLLKIEPKDYFSFGLADKKGYLTNAGRLFADQYIVYNSRVFCTRWNGLEKGSIFDDALDDKEFEGNIIYLLKNTADFIRNNSKVRFYKDAQYRIDKPDYAERAVTEAVVNALIHRDYIISGCEVHVDMYDDRLEITSPGGMFDGKAVQERDIADIGSMRRNPVIADLFHRMKYMERRGSGLKKIMNETAKLPGYSEALKPEFYSDGTSFRIVLKSANYGEDVSDKVSDKMSDKMSDKLNAREQEFYLAILKLLNEQSFVTTKVISDNIAMPESTTRRYLKKLCMLALIRADGKNKGKKYYKA